MQPNNENIHKGAFHHIKVNKHLLMGYFFLALVFLGAISAVYYWDYKNQNAAAAPDESRHVGSGENVQTNGQECDGKFVLAQNPQTGETREFTSACYVLPPWQIVDKKK